MNKVIVSNCKEFKEGDILGVGPFSFNPFAAPKIGKSKKKSFVIAESSWIQAISEIFCPV